MNIIPIQFDLFESKEKSEIEALTKEIEKIHTSTEKVRKSLFAKNGELTKQVDELNRRLQFIERNICQKNTVDNILSDIS